MNEPRPDGTRRGAAAAGASTAAVWPLVLAANDPASTRMVYAMIIGLGVLGIGFILLGVWVIRRTRVDPPVLGPLELMGERRWKRRDPATQRRLLDDARPPGATPLRRQPAPPLLLAEFDAPRPAASLTDLGPGLGGGAEPAGAEPAVPVDEAVADAEDPADAPADAEAPDEDRPDEDRPDEDRPDEVATAEDEVATAEEVPDQQVRGEEVPGEEVPGEEEPGEEVAADEIAALAEGTDAIEGADGRPADGADGGDADDRFDISRALD